MGEERYTSIYLPRELKIGIVTTAEAEGFVVSRGRQSCLAKFIEVILQEHKRLSQHNCSASSLYQLAPELRSSIARLGKMSPSRQKRASMVLHLLLSDWEEQDGIKE